LRAGFHKQKQWVAKWGFGVTWFPLVSKGMVRKALEQILNESLNKILTGWLANGMADELMAKISLSKKLMNEI